MVDLESDLLVLRAAVLADLIVNEERLALVDRWLAEARMLANPGGEAADLTGKVGAGSVGSDELAAVGVNDAGVQSCDFLVPAVDPKTGEPVYDPRIVAGRGTLRWRAYAAARVYGAKLRQRSLAIAIFETGETNAAAPVGVSSSLRTLVKYRKGWWERDNGWLYYLGALTPDVEMIRLLSDEAAAGAVNECSWSVLRNI